MSLQAALETAEIGTDVPKFAPESIRQAFQAAAELLVPPCSARALTDLLAPAMPGTSQTETPASRRLSARSPQAETEAGLIRPTSRSRSGASEPPLNLSGLVPPVQPGDRPLRPVLPYRHQRQIRARGPAEDGRGVIHEEEQVALANPRPRPRRRL